MTVQSTDHRIPYTGNGSVVDFTFNMKTYDSNWIDVYEDGVLSVAIIIVTLNADQKNNPGGSVNITPAPALDVAIIIERYVPLDQLIDYTSYNGFPADNTENGLDKLTFIVQQLLFDHSRAVRQSGYEDLRNMLLPSITDRALRYPVFDQEGNIEVADLLAIPVQYLSCVVNINNAPYNADPTGVTNSTAGIKAAIASGATIITGCGGVYWVDDLELVSGQTLFLPGVEFISKNGPAEGTDFSFGANTSTTENVHVTIDKLTNYNNIFASDYKNCSLSNCTIFNSEFGLEPSQYNANGAAENLALNNVIFEGCNQSAIVETGGIYKNADINFTNVSVIACAGIPVSFTNVSGFWKGGSIKANSSVIDKIVQLVESNGFEITGVTFDNGATDDLMTELHISGPITNGGVNICNNSFISTDVLKGRSQAIWADNMYGGNIQGNRVLADANDHANFIGIRYDNGTSNLLISGNAMTGFSGAQARYSGSDINNYVIENGVKK